MLDEQQNKSQMMTRRHALRGLLAGSTMIPLAACGTDGVAVADLFGRQTLARQLVELVFNNTLLEPFTKAIKSLGLAASQLLALALGVDIGPIFQLVFDRFVDQRIAAVSSSAIDIFANTFSLSDLTQLVQVYRSSTGQKLAQLSYSQAAGGAFRPNLTSNDIAQINQFRSSPLGQKTTNAMGEVLRVAFSDNFQFGPKAREELVQGVRQELRARGYSI